MNDEHILAVPGGGTCPHPCEQHVANTWGSFQLERLNPKAVKPSDIDGTLELMATRRYSQSS